MKADIVYHGKFIIGYSLLIRPSEQIISRSHKQRGIFDRVFLISAQWRSWVFFCNTVKISQ